MSGRKSAPADVVEAVDRWNATYPVGTPVRYWPGERVGEGIKSNTRSAATANHGSNYGMVFVDGRSGGILLGHVEARVHCTTCLDSGDCPTCRGAVLDFDGQTTCVGCGTTGRCPDCGGGDCEVMCTERRAGPCQGIPARAGA